MILCNDIHEIWVTYSVQQTLLKKYYIMPEKDPVPKDKVNLRLLLVDGKSHDFLFPPTSTSSEIAQHVFNNWPESWTGDNTTKPDRPEVLRLIYRGRFLHSSTTLEYLSLPLGKTSTLHMIVREKLPDANQMGLIDARAKVVSQEHTRCCNIL